MSFVYGLLFGLTGGLIGGVVLAVWLLNTPVNKDVIDEIHGAGVGPF